MVWDFLGHRNRFEALTKLLYTMLPKPFIYKAIESRLQQAFICLWIPRWLYLLHPHPYIVLMCLFACLSVYLSPYIDTICEYCPLGVLRPKTRH